MAADGVSSGCSRLSVLKRASCRITVGVLDWSEI